MTPKEIYEWAVDHKCEDYDILFQIDVGNEQVELAADQIWLPSGQFEIMISLI